MKLMKSKIEKIIQLAKKRDVIESNLMKIESTSQIPGIIDLSQVPDIINNIEYIKLIDYISKLSDLELAEITALYWMGMYDEDLKNWDGLVKHAEEVTCIDYICAKRHLAKYLEIGKNRFN